MTQKTYKKIQKTFQPGEIIFEDGAPCEGMYVIHSGLVAVYKTISGTSGTKEIELARIGSKGMFGEMSLIGENKRSASAKAVETTIATLVTREMFNDQIGRLPGWVLNLIKLLSNRLRATNARLQSLQEQRFIAGQDEKALPPSTSRASLESDDDDDDDDDDELSEERPNFKRKKEPPRPEPEEDDDDDDELDEEECEEEPQPQDENPSTDKPPQPSSKDKKLSAERNDLLKNLDF